MTTAIHIAGLRFAYPPPLPGGDAVLALRGVDLHVQAGEFIVLMGPAGAGKSTLCFALNGAIPHAIDGESEGQVIVCGLDTRTTPMAQVAMQVGLVFENAEAQLFNRTAADEVAFGLEAMGLPVDEIEARIDESLAVVGLAGFRERSTHALSGGEQKRLALASVLAMRPRVLVLDEPTMGLDPRGRQAVIAAIHRLRFEIPQGMTVIMATQDAEAAARFADRIVVLQQGRVALSGSPVEVFAQVGRFDSWGIDVPQLARLAHHLRGRIPSLPPFSSFRPSEVCEALAETLDVGSARLNEPPRSLRTARSAEPLIEIRNLSYRYPTAQGLALQDVSLEVRRGDWLAVIGVNGSGKSTLIRHLNGLLKPTSGQVLVAGHDTRARQVGELARTVSYLPQNPDRLIFTASVREEVAYGPRQLGLSGDALRERVTDTLDQLDLLPYAEHPPAVLSYGMRRQVALASALAMDTPALALDEPAVGLGRGAIEHLMEIISHRHRQGTTVVMITHDLSLVVRYAQRVAVLYQGHLVTCGPPTEVLADIDGLASVELEPLPVTVLAHLLGWPPPLPLDTGAYLRVGLSPRTNDG